jgi:hypothetical protein
LLQHPSLVNSFISLKKLVSDYGKRYPESPLNEIMALPALYHSRFLGEGNLTGENDEGSVFRVINQSFSNACEKMTVLDESNLTNLLHVLIQSELIDLRLGRLILSLMEYSQSNQKDPDELTASQLAYKLNQYLGRLNSDEYDLTLVNSKAYMHHDESYMAFQHFIRDLLFIVGSEQLDGQSVKNGSIRQTFENLTGSHFAKFVFILLLLSIEVDYHSTNGTHIVYKPPKESAEKILTMVVDKFIDLKKLGEGKSRIKLEKGLRDTLKRFHLKQSSLENYRNNNPLQAVARDVPLGSPLLLTRLNQKKSLLIR